MSSSKTGGCLVPYPLSKQVSETKNPHLWIFGWINHARKKAQISVIKNKNECVMRQEARSSVGLMYHHNVFFFIVVTLIATKLLNHFVDWFAHRYCRIYLSANVSEAQNWATYHLIIVFPPTGLDMKSCLFDDPHEVINLVPRSSFRLSFFSLLIYTQRFCSAPRK